MAEARDGEAVRAALHDALAACERELDRRNVTVVGSLAHRMLALRRLLEHGRLPRVAAIGRRGSGKSSLLNAILGREALAVGDVGDRTTAVAWRMMAAGARRVEWLDTPGLRAGAKGGRREEVAAAVRATPPDVVLVLCQATEVDAGIDEDLEDALAIVKAAEASGRDEVPVVGVVTKVDELAPADVTAPPFDDPEKRANIVRATSVFLKHLARAGRVPHAVIPVASYVEWREGAVAYDGRWNVDRLVARVQGLLPEPARLRGALLCDELDAALRGIGEEVTEAFAALAHAIGSGPPDAQQRDELARVQGALVTILRSLSTRGDPARSPSARVEALLRPGTVLEGLRGGLARLGARGASGAVAAARTRALGRAVMAIELDGVDPETVKRLWG